MSSTPSQITPRVLLWLFCTCLVLNIGVTRGHFQATDEIGVYQQARSLWERGELDVVPMLNTRIGPNGRAYAAYGVGQSLAAAPLYGVGRWLQGALTSRPEWAQTLAGPVVGDPNTVCWGGEVEIFVVNLFCALITALLCVQFFLFSTAVGASLRAALISTAAFATSSYIASFSSTFLQHSLEALTLFSCFYLLFTDSVEPNGLRRAGAGALAAYGVLVRAQVLAFLPALCLYLLWNGWKRLPRQGRFTLAGFKALSCDCGPFAALVVFGIVAQALVSAAKFGDLSYSGAYGGQSYSEPLLTTLYGLILSPGKGMLVYTPLLMLMPVYWGPFILKHRAAAYFALAAVASYVLLFAKYEGWHGTWFLGPRYLAATVPFLLLPFASWWDRSPWSWRCAALGLAAIGTFVQALHVSVNFSYVWFAEGYDKFLPKDGYLFIPETSPLAAYYRAWIAGDGRIDMWLVNVYRTFGLARLLTVSGPLAAAFVFSLWRLVRAACNVTDTARLTLKPEMASHVTDIPDDAPTSDSPRPIATGDQPSAGSPAGLVGDGQSESGANGGFV